MQRTIEQAVAQYGQKMQDRFIPICQKQRIAFPPKSLTLLAFKEEKKLEIWTQNATSQRVLLASYPILAASGALGPKRREGDGQVPEGFYNLTVLNPNSRFHLSVRVDYPNTEDIKHKVVERDKMGFDIYIHGNQVSIGCLAMGDAAIEEIFPLIAAVGLKQSKILIAPVDLRSRPIPRTTDAWVASLYKRLQIELKKYRG
jgi:murein L,D-transpeptidase YafK